MAMHRRTRSRTCVPLQLSAAALTLQLDTSGDQTCMQAAWRHLPAEAPSALHCRACVQHPPMDLRVLGTSPKAMSMVGLMRRDRDRVTPILLACRLVSSNWLGKLGSDTAVTCCPILMPACRAEVGRNVPCW